MTESVEVRCLSFGLKKGSEQARADSKRPARTFFRFSAGRMLHARGVTGLYFVASRAAIPRSSLRFSLRHTPFEVCGALGKLLHFRDEVRPPITPKLLNNCRLSVRPVGLSPVEGLPPEAGNRCATGSVIPT
jgi:hypothetical protein